MHGEDCGMPQLWSPGAERAYVQVVWLQAAYFVDIREPIRGE